MLLIPSAKRSFVYQTSVENILVFAPYSFSEAVFHLLPPEREEDDDDRILLDEDCMPVEEERAGLDDERILLPDEREGEEVL